MTEEHAVNPIDAQPASSSPARMYAVVLGVGIACSLAIVTVYETTRPIIRRNTIELRDRAILNVVPRARSSAPFRWTDDGFEPASTDSTDAELVFAAYDANDKLVGLAIEAEAMGYQDVVRVLYGYSLERQTVVGMRVLQSRETPGLGDRIETDAGFLRNFQALDVRVGSFGNQLAHPIEFVKSGEKESPWQIDGISGATITSRATASMLRESTTKWIPRVYPRQAEFQHTRRED